MYVQAGQKSYVQNLYKSALFYLGKLSKPKVMGNQLFCSCRKVYSWFSRIGKIKYALSIGQLFLEWEFFYFFSQAEDTAVATAKCTSFQEC